MLHLLAYIICLSSLSFVAFTAEDGISSNNVLAVMQDRLGYMWFGTDNGLTRFDGAHSIVYKSDTIAGNVVMALAADSAGNIWAGATDGLSAISPDGVVNFLSDDHGNYVRALHGSPDGGVWAAYFDGWLERFELIEGEVVRRERVHYDMPSIIEGEYWYQQIFEDNSGRLWLGGRKMQSQYAENGMSHLLDHRVCGSYAQAPDGTIYSYDDFHPMLTRLENGKFVDVFQIPVAHARLLFDRRGRLWAAGSYGLVWIDPCTGNTAKYLDDKEINCIYESSDGCIWLGSESGVYLLDGRVNQVESLCLGVGVTALLQDRNGQMWTGTNGGEAHGHSPGRRISSLYEDSEGRIYIGLWEGKGFYLYDPITRRFTLHKLTGERLGSNWYSDFLEDSRGRIWAASWEGIGLNEFDCETGHFTDLKVDGLCTRLATCLMEDGLGNIWYGTSEDGLNLISGNLDVTGHYFPGQFITCLAESGGVIFVGTKRGLYSIPSDGIHGCVAGLDMQISSIEEDSSGRIWVSTVSGLYLLDGEQALRVDKHLGFNSDVYGMRVSCRLADGSLAFGGGNGYNVFNPDSLLAYVSCPTVLVSFRRGGKTSSRENALIFDFSSTDYSTGRYISYRYMLEGEDELWNYCSYPELSARYSNLIAGSYTLRVQAADNLGRWPEEGWSMSFRVLRPLLLSWPFICGYILLLTSAVILIIKFRERRLRHDKSLLESTVAQRTRQLQDEIDSKNSLFSIVAHDLKNPVKGVKYLSDTVEKHFDELTREEARAAVVEISQASGRTVEMLDSLLLWALNQKDMIRPDMQIWELKDIVNEAVDDISGQAVRKCVTIFTDIPAGYQAVTDFNLMTTILRNLLSNAVKFSNPGSSVEINVNGDRLSVRDYGRGISSEDVTAGTSGEKGSGLGLRIVRELLDKMGGSLEIQSEPRKGSTFTINIRRA